MQNMCGKLLQKQITSFSAFFCAQLYLSQRLNERAVTGWIHLSGSWVQFGHCGAASRQESKQNTCETEWFSALLDKMLPNHVNFPPRHC